MPISSYPNGFQNGVTIRGIPINVAYPGRVFWLNNSSVISASNGLGGSDINPGTYQKPFATLAGALVDCTAGRGDIIMVGAGHAETISSATALSLNVAGVAIVGAGAGGLRPTFTLDTATTATINVTANDISIINCLFKANFAAIASLFTLTTAKNFMTERCDFRDNSSILNFKQIITTDATSNDADGISMENCNWFGLGATANSCLVNMAGTNDRMNLRNNYITHAATTAAGLMPIATGKVVTNMTCIGNFINLVSASSATTGILITTNGSTNSGVLQGNFIQSLDDTSPILVTGSSGFKYYNNYYSSVADTSGFLLPAVGT